MAYARLIAGTWNEVAGPFTVGDGDEAVTYPAGWLDSATPEQRAELGAVAIVDEPAPAEGFKLTGQVLVDEGGVPHRRWVAPAIGDLRQALRDQVAAIRWAKQQTMKWRGRVAASDDVTTGRIVAALFRAQATGDQTATVRWKFGPNDFDTLTLADLTAYGMAIGAHLQACFDYEAGLVETINGTVGASNVAAIDIASGWPV